MLRALFALILTIMMTVAATAQESAPATETEEFQPREGAPTLDDILARQRGEDVDLSWRLDQSGTAAAGISEQLGTLGGASDSEVFLALRYGTADVTVSTNAPAAGVLIQDRGMWWYQVREGWLSPQADSCCQG